MLSLGFERCFKEKFINFLEISLLALRHILNYNVKNSNVTNSRRVSAYLGHHQTSAILLKYRILNLTYKMARKILLTHDVRTEI